ncbi:MAG: hypothetical protein M1816_005413 [Peltula sp. TS41687]|nr:MAG: hypothetical protein M1816_005413 [Peltula sp. TS41687]
MDIDRDVRLERTVSQTSSISNISRRSETVRIRSRKLISPAKTATHPDKSLTSFPSLSPDSSPKDPRVDAPNNVQPPNSPTHRARLATPTVHDLAVLTPSLRRTALFSDSPLQEHLVPGTLHHTTDEHIERLAARHGAVALIRQLAEDVAQRDAQMAALQRRAEEREKTLRKMLLECEVSNMDIEARLHRIMSGESAALGKKGKAEGGATSVKSTSEEETLTSSVEGSIGDLVNQAMADAVGKDAEDEPSSPHMLRKASKSFRYDTVREGTNVDSSDDYARFMRSAQSHEARHRVQSRGWMDYLWLSGGTSRKASRASSVVENNGEDGSGTARPRMPSGTTPRRPALQSDLFRPPDDTSSGRPSSQETGEGKGQGHHSRRSSTSVAAWATKLVAGNSRVVSNGQLKNKDHPAAQSLSHARRPSITSGKTAESAKAALRRINETRFGGQVSRRVTPLINLGPSGTIKGSNPAKFSNPAPSPTTSVTVGGPINSGPVEMDAILPPDSQPPTLVHKYSHYHPTEFITDRFGFIYDRRRTLAKDSKIDQGTGETETLPKIESSDSVKEIITGSSNEQAERVSINLSICQTSSPLDSRPGSPASSREEGREQKSGKKWQDYLKTATFPTELLSHTPAGGRMSDVHASSSNNDVVTRLNQITVADGGTILPANLSAQLSAPTVVADHVTFARTTTSDSTMTPKKAQQEPVRMLLEQLTELHDSLQRERTIKWNEFLRKVRAERRKEGEISTTSDGRQDSRLMPEAALTDGEVIGVAGLGNKGKIGRAKWKEFMRLVLDGIPVAYRAKIWAECSGASAMRTPGYYDDLIQNGVDDPVIVAQISMDINRTLTDNVFFRDGPGVVKLHEVLIAYSRRNPEIGYCQGMNLIAGSLLLIMPTSEEAFWLLTSMIENILPANYYDDSLLASRADQQVLRQYVTDILPRLSAHLDELNIELEALTFQWFLSVFTGCLSAEALFRVWDVVLCTNDGSTFLFQVALALLSLNERQLLQCRTPAGVYSYINQHMTNHAISIDGLIHASDALKKVVTRSEIEERRAKVIEREKELMKKRAELVRMRSKSKDIVTVTGGGGGGGTGNAASALLTAVATPPPPPTAAEMVD